MRMHIALVVGLALISADAKAQQFQIEDVASVDALPVAQLKPKTIAFNDRGSDEIADAGGIFVRYEDWAKAKPLQQQFLSLYPGYAEPNVDVIVDGTKKRYREKLHMYVAQARFVVAKPSASLDLARYVTLPFAQQLDPAIKHRLITSADLVRPKEAKIVHNQNPQRRWCEDRPAATICLHSAYKLEGLNELGQLNKQVQELSAKLGEKMGGGSLTALPIIETQAGDVSAYIPTNVISITDGQIYLEPDLFYAGVRPAVNVGISVSRVGGNAQTKAMKKVAGKLRLDLAQYRELEAFAQFASDLDAGTKAQLARGERTVEILKQPTAATWPMEEQVAIIFAVGQGLLDDVPVEDVARFQSEMVEALRASGSPALKAVKESRSLEDDTAAMLKEEIEAFKRNSWKGAEVSG